LDDPFLCSFTNGSSKDKTAGVNEAGVFCEVTILGGPSMFWKCWGCRFAIYSYNNVLATVWSNESSGVLHSTAQDNEN